MRIFYNQGILSAFDNFLYFQETFGIFQNFKLVPLFYLNVFSFYWNKPYCSLFLFFCAGKIDILAKSDDHTFNCKITLLLDIPTHWLLFSVYLCKSRTEFDTNIIKFVKVRSDELIRLWFPILTTFLYREKTNSPSNT